MTMTGKTPEQDGFPRLLLRVLGEVTVIDEDGEHPVTRQSLAKLLSILALAPGTWYSAEALHRQVTCSDYVGLRGSARTEEAARRRGKIKDGVWKLRNMYSTVLRPAIEQQGTNEDLCYRLNLAPQSIDIHRIPHLLEEAEALLEEGDFLRSLAMGCEAERLCRGTDMMALLSCDPDATPPDFRFQHVTALAVIGQAAYQLGQRADVRRAKRTLRDLAERSEDCDIWAKYIETVAALDGRDLAAAAWSEAKEMLTSQSVSLTKEFCGLARWIGHLPNNGGLSTNARPVAPMTPTAPASTPTPSGNFLHYSFNDVGGQFEAIVRAIDEEGWEPDVIFGINRGGAILGGMLAKQYRHDVYWPVHVLRDPRRPDRLKATLPGAPKGEFQRILLTDEAYRAGRHAPVAMAALRHRYGNADIRYATYIKQFESEVDPGHPGTPPDFFGEESMTAGFTLPWDRS